MIHCWKAESDQYEFGSTEWADCVNRGDATCMLEEGHIGNHGFIPVPNHYFLQLFNLFAKYTPKEFTGDVSQH